MPLDKRTERERIYVEILRKRGDLTNVELRNAASDYPIFRDMNDYAREKDVDRFVRRGEYIGFLTRTGGKLQLLYSLSPPRVDKSQPRAGQFVLSKDGFLTSRAGIICRHCMKMIDLTQVQIWRRLKSDTLLRMLHVHHFFWITCPYCTVKARYDMNKDVKPILPDSAE